MTRKWRLIIYAAVGIPFPMYAIITDGDLSALWFTGLVVVLGSIIEFVTWKQGKL